MLLDSLSSSKRQRCSRWRRWEWNSNFLPHFIGHLIPCSDWSLSMPGKGASGNQGTVLILRGPLLSQSLGSSLFLIPQDHLCLLGIISVFISWFLFYQLLLMKIIENNPVNSTQIPELRLHSGGNHVALKFELLVHLVTNHIWCVQWQLVMIRKKTIRI